MNYLKIFLSHVDLLQDLKNKEIELKNSNHHCDCKDKIINAIMKENINLKELIKELKKENETLIERRIINNRRIK